MRDYCVCVTDINCHVSSPKMFRRDYSILEKFHWRNSKFCQPVKSNLTPFHPPDILFETTTPTSPSLLPSLLPFFRFAARRKLTLLGIYSPRQTLYRVSNMFDIFSPPSFLDSSGVYIFGKFQLFVLAHERIIPSSILQFRSKLIESWNLTCESEVHL